MDEPQIDSGLRRQLGAMARQEMEAAERQAAALAGRQRSLVDVCWLAVQSGVGITVRIGNLELSGMPTYARGDLLSLETRFNLAEVNLAAIDGLAHDMTAQGAGRSVPHEAESFVARLGMIQLTGEQVEIVHGPSMARVAGCLVTVARDHVVLETTGGPVHLRTGSIAAVLRGSQR